MQAIRSDPEKTLVARGPSTYGSRLARSLSSGRPKAGPVGLAGTTSVDSHRRINRRLPAPQIAFAQENIKPRADADGRARDGGDRRHAAEHDGAEHHRPDDH